MHQDVDKVWFPMQKELFDKQQEIEKQAIDIKQNSKRSG